MAYVDLIKPNNSRLFSVACAPYATIWAISTTEKAKKKLWKVSQTIFTVRASLAPPKCWNKGKDDLVPGAFPLSVLVGGRRGCPEPTLIFEFQTLLFITLWVSQERTIEQNKLRRSCYVTYNKVSQYEGGNEQNNGGRSCSPHAVPQGFYPLSTNDPEDQ